MVLGISLPLGAHEKFSFLFSKTKGGAGTGGMITVGIGIMITIIYWLVYSFFMFLGYSKILPLCCSMDYSINFWSSCYETLLFNQGVI